MADAAGRYDLIVVGSGFGAGFFLLEALRHLKSDAKVLVLERGRALDAAWQRAHRRNSDVDPFSTYSNRGWQHKVWDFTVALGGGSNCWTGNVHRMLPNDFLLKTRYGVGVDWAFGYADLAPYYDEAEELMQISGGPTSAVAPRERPHPQPPHRFSKPDEVLQKAYPELFFHFPTARARLGTATRPACCGSGVCNNCPIGAKFTIAADLPGLLSDPRIEVRTGANVRRLERQGGSIRSVAWLEQGRERSAQADLVLLGANSLFNAEILLRSGMDDGVVGRYLSEQVQFPCRIYLDGLDAFNGSTKTTGIGFMTYDGDHRRQSAASFFETFNIGPFRPDAKRYRQVLHTNFVFEDLQSADNRVTVSAADADMPQVDFKAYSDYTYAGYHWVKSQLERLLAPLPVERVVFQPTPSGTISHNLGTTRMGMDPGSSVVDLGQLHHRTRNLVVVGGSVFPTTPAVNPTLTIAAMSLRAARRLYA